MKNKEYMNIALTFVIGVVVVASLPVFGASAWFLVNSITG
jgi:hypothetical protein